MLGRENTGSALCSGAVDADFWALVCEDEEWLDAEFDAIVSAACETPTRQGAGSAPVRIRTPARGGDADHPVTPGRAARAPAGRALAAATGSARAKPPPRPGCPPTQMPPHDW